MDTSHLVALHERLSNERRRLAESRTAKERELRRVWVAQIEKEVASEEARLGVSAAPEAPMSDDELLATLLEP